MKKIILNTFILFIVLHANAQRFDLKKDDTGQIMQIEFFDTIRGTKTKTIDLIEANPFLQNFREYKDSAYTTFRCFEIDGNLFLDDVIPADKREMYEPEPKHAAEINQIKIEEILLAIPIVTTSSDPLFVTVVYNQAIYSGKGFSKGLCGVNSKIIIYNNTGKLVHEFEFGSTIGSIVMSGDGRYLSFTYEEGDANWILVKAGMTIYDCYQRKIVLQKSFDDNSYNPSSENINEFHVSAASISNKYIQYFVADLSSKQLFEIKIPFSIKGDLDITKNGFTYYTKEDNVQVIKLFSRDFNVTKF